MSDIVGLARNGIKEFIELYNEERLHSSIGYTNPCVVYRSEKAKLGLHKLGTLLFGRKSEKNNGGENTDQSPEEKGQETEGSDTPNPPSSSLSQGQEISLQKPKGHGRFGVNVYADAETVTVEQPTLKPGDPCPESCGGKLYSIEPSTLVLVTGLNIPSEPPFRWLNFYCFGCPYR